MQQAEGGSAGARPLLKLTTGRRRDHGLERSRLEPVVEQLLDPHGHAPQQLREIAPAQSAQPAREAQEGEQLAGPAPGEIRRRPGVEGAQHAGVFGDAFRERGPPCGVARRVMPDGPGGAPEVAAEHQPLARPRPQGEGRFREDPFGRRQP